MEGVFRLSDQEIDAIASRVVEKMKSSHSLQSIDDGGEMVAEDPLKMWRILDWYRRNIAVATEPPAIEEAPKPAWEPKVGDWVLVTRPENWKEWKDPLWREEMHIYDGKVFEFVKWSQWSAGQRASLQGIDWFFHRDWLTPSSKHFAKPPAKEPQPVENPAGPMPDPEEGCRILTKEPLEELRPGDEFWCRHRMAWIESVNARNGYGQASGFWYRRKIEPPASEEPAKEPKPAWEPKVGDWVRVTRPQNWEECTDPDWLPIMHEYHDKVMQVSSYENRWGAWCAKCDGVGWFFHRDWLTPSIQYFAEPPEIDKPLETEYQRPSLPEDAGKLCEFSDDGESWVKGYLKGFDCDRHWNEGTGWLRAQNFSADRARHRHARIKKD